MNNIFEIILNILNFVCKFLLWNFNTIIFGIIKPLWYKCYSFITLLVKYFLFGKIESSVLFFNISSPDEPFFAKLVNKINNTYNIINSDITLFDIHTKGSGFTFKIIGILLLITFVLYFLNIYSNKLLYSLNNRQVFFNPFVLWVLAWLIDLVILFIRFFFFNDKYLDFQFIFVPSLVIWILFRLFFFRKESIANAAFLNDWLDYQTKNFILKYIFDKISKNKEKSKSALFYWSIQIFILDCTICTTRILIYGCLILGRLDFTISFIIFITMIYIYRKKLK